MYVYINSKASLFASNLVERPYIREPRNKKTNVNKGADQLMGAFFRYSDSKISFLLKSEISSF